MKLHLELMFCLLFRLLDNDFLYNCLLMNLLIQNIFRFWGGGFDVQYMQIAVGGPKCPFSLKNVKITVLHCAACIFWIDLCINFKHGCNNGLHHQEAPLTLGLYLQRLCQTMESIHMPNFKGLVPMNRRNVRGVRAKMIQYWRWGVLDLCFFGFGAWKCSPSEIYKFRLQPFIKEVILNKLNETRISFFGIHINSLEMLPSDPSFSDLWFLSHKLKHILGKQLWCNLFGQTRSTSLLKWFRNVVQTTFLILSNSRVIFACSFNTHKVCSFFQHLKIYLSYRSGSSGCFFSFLLFFSCADISLLFCSPCCFFLLRKYVSNMIVSSWSWSC